MSNGDATEAKLQLPSEYDFSDGKYECALIEMTLPNTQSLSIPESDVKILWFSDKHFENIIHIGFVESTPTHSNHVFVTESLDLRLASFSHQGGTQLCSMINDIIKQNTKYTGKPPVLKYQRGFVSITVASRNDETEHVAYGLPIFSEELQRALGLDEDYEKMKTFLLDCKADSSYTASKVANLNLNVFFNEIHFNAVKSIVPRNNLIKILRYVPNVPTTPRTVYFRFDPPIWCPVEREKFKEFVVRIKDNDGRDVSFSGGESMFQIGFRRSHG